MRQAQTNTDCPRTPDEAEELVALGAEAVEMLRIARKEEVEVTTP
jgi:hypothetical protein